MQEEWSVLIAALNHTLCHTVYLSKLSQNPFCTLVFMKIRIDVSQSVWHGIIYKYISPIRQFGSRFTAADSHICNGWLCCSSYVPYEQITRFSELLSDAHSHIYFQYINVMCGSYDYFAIVTACPQSSITQTGFMCLKVIEVLYLNIY